MKIKSLFIIGLLTSGILISAFTLPKSEVEGSKTIEWQTNYEDAVALAKKEKKDLLLNFTGSDWCGWCKKLNKEVFSQDDFIKFANKELVCVTVDFPRSKKLSAEESKQNQDLASKYGIRGFPTIIILDNTEKSLLRTGYQSGGAQNYVEHLKPYLTK